jgi:TRAP-type C4-dicarboxylate transport system substrate-binding protein
MKKPTFRTAVILLLTTLPLALLFSTYISGQETGAEVIKLGTLAVKGSSWGNVFEKMDEELQAESKGTLKFKFYFGRDESDLLELLQNKQIDAASMTTVGLGLILPEVYVLQIPFLFSTYEEVDYVIHGLTGDFSTLFKQKNYLLLGWGETGFIYLFSKDPIRTQTDLQKTKLWVRTEDPISRAFAMSSGNRPISLSVESVKHSLENGDVETVYNSPLGCIAFHWYPHVKYLTDLRLVAGLGATLIHRDRFSRLSSRQQNLLQKISAKYHQQLVSVIRKDNQESLQILKDQGITVLSVPHQEKVKWQQIALRIQNRFTGEYYDTELLEKIRKLKAGYRKPSQ